MKLPIILAEDVNNPCIPFTDTTPATVQMREAMEQWNITPPEEIVADGKLHRFRGSGKVNQNNAWYVLHDFFGNFGDWKLTDAKGVGFSAIKNMTEAEKQLKNQQMRQVMYAVKEETEQRYKDVEQWCKDNWQTFTDVPLSHPYLIKKGLKSAYCAKYKDKSLVVPLYDRTGTMTTVQFINPNGSKHYKTGGRVKGSFGIVGHGNIEYIAEGFATAASVYQETGRTCAIACQANNIPAIADYFPAATIIVDDDDAIQGQEYGAGMKYALQTKNKYILIDRALSKNPHTGYDANDYMVEGGDLCQLLGCTKAQRHFKPVKELIKQGKPVEWLIKNIIPARNKLMMLFAGSGEGKTFFAIDWMLSIATGQLEWNGYRVHQGKVLYLCGEGEESANERMAAWYQYHDYPEDEDVPLFVTNDVLNLDNPRDIQNLMAWVSEELNGTPDLICVDTLNLYMEGNENDTQESNQFIQNLKRLAKDYNCTICLIHHKGASETATDRARGSTVFKGAMDSQVSITKDQNTRTYLFHHAKSKAGLQVDDMTFRLYTFDVDGWYDSDGEQEICGVMVTDPKWVMPTQWYRGFTLIWEMPVQPVIRNYQDLEEYEKFFVDAYIECKEEEGGLKLETWREWAKNHNKGDSKTISNKISPTQERQPAGKLVKQGKIVFDESSKTFYEGSLMVNYIRNIPDIPEVKNA